ncbi:MAG: purine-nucleoside phosphorylase [Christensenellales bacterium]|jgi:purine-nucleoside phosphorylase
MLESTRVIRERTDFYPETALVLGSGLNDIAGEMISPVSIDYGDIPGFGHSTAASHAGKLLLGKLWGKNCVIMQGRMHYYDGYTQQELAVPVRTLRELGCKTLVLTNAAGAVNKAFVPGELMLIEDFINFAGVNPLLGPNDNSFGIRFPDMSYALSPRLLAIMEQAARRAGLAPRKGVYAMMTGPSFETPAEIRMLRTLGADAVGMSTVPEILTGVHAGMEVAAISCITNMAAGILDRPLDDDEVVEVGKAAHDDMVALLRGTIEGIN